MKPTTILRALTLITALDWSGLPARAATNQATEPAGILAARWHAAGFADGDDSYNGLSAASDGKIYYVLCAHKIDVGAQMYSYDPASGQVNHIADLTEVTGGKGRKAIPQGKVHVNFYEHAGKLYFATHLGYYRVVEGKEMVGVPPEGYLPYPGGHFLSYDLGTGKFEDLATAPGGEGIITMTMDTRRGVLYGLTWPTAHFLIYDLAKKQLQDLGTTAAMGEKGTGPTYRAVCRTMVVDPAQGGVYFTTSTGDIFRYGGKGSGIEKLTAASLRRDILGQWDPGKPGHMGYNWRQMVWDAAETVFYGTHGNSGYLFSFDPRSQRVDMIDRIASEKTRRSGLYDAFSYGYLGLTMGPDGHTLYYLTGTPLGEEIRFVTYDTRSRKHTDHGAVALEDGSRPTWAQSIAVGRDKRVYTVSKIREQGKLRTDLLSFADPLQAPPAREPRFRLMTEWTNPPGGENPLKEAHNSCLDKNGNIIIVDSIGSRVQRFTPQGKWLGEIGEGPGSGQAQFAGPREARVGGNGDIFVADSNNHRIQVFSHEGKWLRAFGSKGSEPGQMLRVHGLAFSPDFRRLYVADVDNDRVSVFEPSGKFLFVFGKRGERTGELRDPHGLGVDALGNVYVSGYYGPVSKFTADGKFLFEYAEGGFRGWIHYHYGTADRQGNVYLAARTAADKNAVVMYDRRGAYVTALPVPGEGGKELSMKSIDVSPQGRIYVTIENKGQHGMAVFEKE